MDNDVISPSQSWAKILSEVREDPEANRLELSDYQLSEFSQSDTWKILRSYLESRIAEIKDMFRGKIGVDSYELIGQKAIISDIIQDELLGLIHKVENTHKVVKTNEVKNVKQSKK